MNETASLGTVIPIPSTIEISDAAMPEIVKRYKNLRLTALQFSPSAFSSTYAREVQFTNDIWAARVTNRLVKAFIAVHPKDSSGQRPTTNSVSTQTVAPSPLLEMEWMGIVGVLGPKPLPRNQPEFHSPWKLFTRDNSSGAPDLASIRNTHAVYVIVGMFVHPQVQRVGYGRRLLDAAVTAAVLESRAASASHITICLEVTRDNVPAAKLYESAGFRIREDRDKQTSGEDIHMVWEQSFL
jgi:GNAT superfamily N-acetyltransferase